MYVTRRFSVGKAESLTSFRHAAASYAQIQVLDFLISAGGNVNITDSDGETPLYTVESIDMARYLIDKGAAIDIHNIDGESVSYEPFVSHSTRFSSPPMLTRFTFYAPRYCLQPADKLEEDFPEVADYLRSRSSTDDQPHPTSTSSQSPHRPSQPSQFVTEQAAEQMTSGLMNQIQQIMEQADRDGIDPQERLQEVLGDAFLTSAQAGRNLASASGDTKTQEENEPKRVRRDTGKS